MRAALFTAVCLLFGLAPATIATASRSDIPAKEETAASNAIRTAAGTPDPKPMVLASSDLGGAKVTAQGYDEEPDFPSTYVRELRAGRVGSTRLGLVDSEVKVGRSSEVTAAYLGAIRRALGTKQGHAVFARLFPTGGFATKPTLGRPRDVGIGLGSFDLPITFKVRGVRTVAHLAVFRVEQVLGTVAAVGVPGRTVPLSLMTGLAKLMATRISVALVPTNNVLPTISGTPQAGQTLTATPGTWSGNPATYAYQWQRCNASGANCADIPAVCEPGGSLCSAPPVVTDSSYLATSQDSTNDSTIRVTVTATNALGTATAVSAPTASVVPAPRSQWPTSTSAPTIAGELHVGQTLTATTGTWTANPTSFTVVWQRCDTSNQPSCLPTGTGGGSLTYLVGSAALGFKIRVCVIAYNAAGGGGACSGRSEEIT